MRNITFLLCFWTIPATAQLSIVPYPTKLTQKTGEFIFSSQTKIVAPASVSVALFRQQMAAVTGYALPSSETGEILFLLDETQPEEGYQLSVQPTKIEVKARNEAGFFYATQTLLQLLPADVFSEKSSKSSTWRIPCVEITDAPRFPYRGLHLDVGRHFFPVAFIKKYLDVMAQHKLNRFHWHLTEDQGWRIEIKKYPKLTSVGGFRKGTIKGQYHTYFPQVSDNEPYGGFYTQDEVREVVRYAAERQITVIPEIELPGHSLAALTAYPELGCENKPYEVAIKWGVFDDVFCPTEKTFNFLEDVLTEVIALFPSTYIHIGGDECPKEAWKKSAFCQNLIKEKGLKDEHELQSYFIQRIEKFLNTKGRQIIGWDEILEGGLAPNATVMSWRGIRGGIEAARQKHQVIMTPGTHCYLDHYQADPHTEPLAIGGFTTLEKSYSYEPIPTELTPEEGKYILGCQGNVWTEYMKTPEQAAYMAFPRALALAEVGWSSKENRNWESFRERIQSVFQRLDAQGMPYAKSLFDVRAVRNVTPNNINIELKNFLNDVDIRYTLDGSTPKATSPKYGSPFIFTKTTALRAATFRGGNQLGKVMKESVEISPITGLLLTVEGVKPEKAGWLTDTQRGSDRFRGTWTGVFDKDFVLNLDLTKKTSVKTLNIGFLQMPSDGVRMPENITIETSDDGTTWQQSGKSIALNPLKTGHAGREAVSVKLNKKTRFVRLKAKNVGKIDGRASWIYADEIEVR